MNPPVYPLPWLFVSALALPSLRAQTIDYPDSTLAAPPQIAFPFYTPGGGSTGQTVRVQWLCPASFLAAQNVAAGLVTRIGLPLAGQAAYSVFELRAGASAQTSLGSDWSVNLPDQRVQCDLSGTMLQGGGSASAPTNQWVEFELDFPFPWQPGQGIVVDLTAQILLPGSYLGSSVGAGVARAVNFSYAPGAPATSFTGNGVAFRLVFAPHGLVSFGAGCTAPGGVVPVLSGLGDGSRGSTVLLLADQSLAPAVGGFVLGVSRSAWSGGLLPWHLGGGCALLVSPDAFAVAPITPVGGGLGSAALALPVPDSPWLVGAVVYAQWAQVDPASLAVLPFTLSNAGAVAVW
jgi:hypothetical protein